MRRSEDGFHLPSWVFVASLVLVIVATLAFFITGSPDKQDEAAPPTPSVSSEQTEEPAADPADEPASDKKDQKKEKKKKPAEVQPSATVAVFNNSGITGLAAGAATQVQEAGFNVVGTDNWYGNIPETTVYYPDGMKAQADLLAEKLGVPRTRPAVEPMQFDRLTLILTAAL